MVLSLSLTKNILTRFERKKMKSNDKNEKFTLLKEQKYLGKKGMIFFIALMVMFVPFSMDVYLPALPIMKEYFHTSSSLISFTLTAFFIFYALGILIFGPFSDKFGRKKILLLGISVYIIGSILCSISTSVYFLIISRIVQAIGAGCISTVSTALVKDCFSGKARESVLAIVQAMMVIAPMVAPILGALILKLAGWEQTFWILAAVGVLNLIIAIFFQETLPEEERYTGSIGGSLFRLIVIGKNKGFTSFLLLTSIAGAPYMAYVTMSSFIYVDYFKLNAQAYSYFFAANSFFSILGPVLFLRSIGRIHPKKFAAGCFLLALISGIGIIFIGGISPVIFFISFAIFTLISSALRPFSTNILLEQQMGDTGSASSLINAVNSILASLCMVIGSLKWFNMVSGLGIIITVCAVIAIISLLLLLKSSIRVKGINH
jgi:DHA1 family bicyclomycin/chloramphenicol resistance-like MFS transporter